MEKAYVLTDRSWGFSINLMEGKINNVPMLDSVKYYRIAGQLIANLIPGTECGIYCNDRYCFRKRFDQCVDIILQDYKNPYVLVFTKREFLREVKICPNCGGILEE